MKIVYVILIATLFFGATYSALAHQSGCHSNHSCPSDAGSYICGDTGNCSQCPDNDYCKDGQPRSSSSSSLSSSGSNYLPKSREECLPDKVCFVQGDYLTYHDFFDDKLSIISNYTYSGVFDKDKIWVTENFITVQDGKNYPNPDVGHILYPCCGLDVNGQFDIIQPSPVKIEKWTRDSPSAEVWKDKVAEGSYDYNGFSRKVIIINIESPSEIIDKETGILLFHQDNYFGSGINTMKLVDTNIIQSSNTDSKQNISNNGNKNKSIFYDSSKYSTTNSYVDKTHNFSIEPPSNWITDVNKDPSTFPVRFYTQVENPVGFEIEVSDFGKFLYFSQSSDTTVLEDYKSYFIPNDENLIDFKIERYLDGVKIKILHSFFPQGRLDLEPILHENIIFGLNDDRQFIVTYSGYKTQFYQHEAEFEKSVSTFYAVTKESQITSELSSTSNVKIPEWIKKNALWWSEGKIDDTDFVLGIKHLIEQNIMKIPTTESSNSNSQQIPSWIKNNAKWWADGQISDDEFVKGIQYLISNGMMKISTIKNTSLCQGTKLCITGTVEKIVDGDTIYVKGEKIRLSLTNTPEKNEAGYSEATLFTSTMCPVGSTVIVDQDDKQPYDVYGRLLGKVFCGSKMLNEELLITDHAKILTQYCSKSEYENELWAKKFGC